MKKILAVEIQSDEWVRKLIPESTTPNAGRIEILKRNGVELSDKYIELYLKSDQELYDELRYESNIDGNQVTKLFAIFLLSKDYKNLKNYLLFHNDEILVHFLRILVNNNAILDVNIKAIISDIVTEEIKKNISFHIYFLDQTKRMDIGLRLLKEENFEKYLDVLKLNYDEFLYYIFDTYQSGIYSSLKFIKWLCNKVNETMGLDIPMVLKLLSFAIDNALDEQVLDWQDEYKESKAISNVALLMKELLNYNFSCMDVMKAMANDSDYTSYYIITAEGIARTCLDLDYDELERAFFSYGNEILEEWIRNRNDV